MPVSLLAPCIIATKAFIEGCDVPSAILAVQQSMISQLCLATSKHVASDTELVLCVWKWMGTPGATSLMAVIRGPASSGRNRPDMS